eukprot:SAG31_NODE_41434_length_276_cov_0.581921_1_plen_21_part_10
MHMPGMPAATVARGGGARDTP